MLPLVTVRLEGVAELKSRLREKQKAITHAASKGVEAAGIDFASTLQRDYLSGQFVKNQSGIGRRSIHSVMVGEMTAWIGPGAEGFYLKFVNDGARPHIIAPKNGKVLAFTPAVGRIAQSAFARGAG
jgi:hypothetical protein